MNVTEDILSILKDMDVSIETEEDVLLPLDLAGALIDSLDIINIVSELEKKYGIEIDGEDVIPENFNTVRTLADMVKKYLQ